MDTVFSRLLTALARQTGLNELAPEEDGSCTVFFDALYVTMRHLPDSDELLLFSALGVLPEKNRDAFCRRLLEANHFFRETGGGTLSMQPGTDLVGFLLRLPLCALTEAQFLQVLETYVTAAEHWAAACAGGVEDEPAAAGTPAPPAAGWVQA